MGLRVELLEYLFKAWTFVESGPPEFKDLHIATAASFKSLPHAKNNVISVI